MPVSIRSTALDGALQINGVDAIAFNSGGISAKPPTITTSVGANTLNITLNPCVLDFRNVPASASGSTSISITSPLTLTAPSGATLGTIGGITATLAILALNIAGTVELGIVNVDNGIVLNESLPIRALVLNTVSNISNTIYSITGPTQVAFRIVGYIEISQATPGVWVAAPTKVVGSSSNVLDMLSSERPMTQFQQQDVTFLSNTGSNGLFLISNGELYQTAGDAGSIANYSSPSQGNGSQTKYGVYGQWVKVNLNTAGNMPTGEVIKVVYTGEDTYVLTSTGQLYYWA